MNSSSPPHRRWFRYSLRTLFVLVTVSSILAVWLAYVVRVRAEVRRLHPCTDNMRILSGARYFPTPSKQGSTAGRPTY